MSLSEVVFQYLHPDTVLLHDERIITVREEPSLHVNPTSEMSWCGPIQGVQDCTCECPRSQAGTTAAIYRRECHSGRALTLRFVIVAVRSLVRSTEWCKPLILSWGLVYRETA